MQVEVIRIETSVPLLKGQLVLIERMKAQSRDGRELPVPAQVGEVLRCSRAFKWLELWTSEVRVQCCASWEEWEAQE